MEVNETESKYTFYEVLSQNVGSSIIHVEGDPEDLMDYEEALEAYKSILAHHDGLAWVKLVRVDRVDSYMNEKVQFFKEEKK